MSEDSIPEKIEILMRIENALYYLRMKSSYFKDWDDSEEKRLECIRNELTSEGGNRSRQGTG